MTKVFIKETFSFLRDDSQGLLLRDMELRECRLVHCVLSNTYDPKLRSTVRDVRLLDCIFDGGLLGPAILDGVEVRNLKFGRTLHAWGTVFRHVTLSGRMGELIMRPLIDGADAELRPINEANARFYRDVDWALDIQNLDCVECDVSSVPARLIRRDPETQAIIRRDRVHDERRWRDLANTCWAYEIGAMIDEGADDWLLVAGKRSAQFEELMEGIRILRAEGIADPD